MRNSPATLIRMNGEAKWETIAREIRADIAAGRLAPGDRVPGEQTLAERYHVARGTAREAVRRLEQTGVLTPGSPRRVAKRELLTVSLTRSSELVHPGESPTRGADAFLAEAAAAGREPDQEILVIAARASAEVAAHLGYGEGGPVIARQLTRTAGGSRHNMITFWFPWDIAHGTPLGSPESVEEGTLAWLEKRYGKLTHEPATIWPRLPTEAEIAVLDIPPGVAVAEVWRTSLMQGGLPVVTSMSLWPGDRAVLRIEI